MGEPHYTGPDSVEDGIMHALGPDCGLLLLEVVKYCVRLISFCLYSQEGLVSEL